MQNLLGYPKPSWRKNAKRTQTKQINLRFTEEEYKLLQEKIKSIGRKNLCVYAHDVNVF